MVNTIDLQNTVEDCGFKQTRHKGGYAARLPMSREGTI